MDFHFPTIILKTQVMNCIFVLTKNLFNVLSFWMLLIFFILFSVTYGLSILFTRCFDNEDIIILTAITNRVGVDSTIIKKILKKFM